MRKKKKLQLKKSVRNNKKRKILKKKVTIRRKIRVQKNRAKKKIRNPNIVPTPPVVIDSTKKKKRVPAKMYFTQDTEDAIVRYNLEEDIDIREHIYRTKIEYPFQKLVENVFNRFKFSYFETSPPDVQRECLTHLVQNMHKFDPNRVNEKGKKSKAFSYFSIIAKHYLILLCNTNYKRFQQNVEISEERDEHTVQLQHIDKHHAQSETTEFMNLTITFWEENASKIFPKQRDLDIAYAVVELLRSSTKIDAFNKKALYLYIRDISDCKTQQITKVINRMKQYHKNIQRLYLDHGTIEDASHVYA